MSKKYIGTIYDRGAVEVGFARIVEELNTIASDRLPEVARYVYRPDPTQSAAMRHFTQRTSHAFHQREAQLDAAVGDVDRKLDDVCDQLRRLINHQFDDTSAKRLTGQLRYVNGILDGYEAVADKFNHIARQVSDLRESVSAYRDFEEKHTSPTHTSSVATVVQILERFNHAVNRLSRRKRNKERLFTIHDEYDLQDLLYAMMKPLIPDLKDEVPIEGVASDGRLDLASQDLKLIVELKRTRSAEHGKTVLAECRDRLVKYAAWPFLEKMVFFIFDPDNHIDDPDIVEAQLRGPQTIRGRTFTVFTIILSPLNSGRTSVLST